MSSLNLTLARGLSEQERKLVAYKSAGHAITVRYETGGVHFTVTTSISDISEGRVVDVPTFGKSQLTGLRVSNAESLGGGRRLTTADLRVGRRIRICMTYFGAVVVMDGEVVRTGLHYGEFMLGELQLASPAEINWRVVG